MLKRLRLPNTLPRYEEILRHLSCNLNTPISSLKEYKSIILEVMDKEKPLLHARCVCDLQKILFIKEGQLKLENGLIFEGDGLEEIFGGADLLALCLCSLGKDLEEKVGEYFKQNEPLKAIILDAIGSASLERKVETVITYLDEEAKRKNWKLTEKIVPGCGFLSLQDQAKIIELLPSDELGVKLNEQFMLIPRKSLIFLVGMGEKAEKRIRLSPCSFCPRRDKCRVKIFH